MAVHSGQGWYSEERWNHRCWRLQHVPKMIWCAGISLFPLVLYGTDFLWLGKGWTGIHGLLGSGWHRVFSLLLHIHPCRQCWEVPGLGFVITDHLVFSLLSCNLRLAKFSDVYFGIYPSLGSTRKERWVWYSFCPQRFSFFQGLTDEEQPLEVFLCTYNGTSVNNFLPQLRSNTWSFTWRDLPIRGP